jgi:hypothetical protein
VQCCQSRHHTHDTQHLHHIMQLQVVALTIHLCVFGGGGATGVLVVVMVVVVGGYGGTDINTGTLASCSFRWSHSPYTCREGGKRVLVVAGGGGGRYVF